MVSITSEVDVYKQVASSLQVNTNRKITDKSKMWAVRDSSS